MRSHLNFLFCAAHSESRLVLFNNQHSILSVNTPVTDMRVLLAPSALINFIPLAKSNLKNINSVDVF